MATRGIYQIGNTTLYNHWDNYPMGAAFHLCNALKEQHELSLCSLIRGIKECEIHSLIYYNNLDLWGAEYFYEITEDHFVHVYEIGENDNKLNVSTKPVIDFINQEVRLYFATKQNDPNENINDYLLVKINNHYYSVNQAIDMFTKEYNQAVDQFNKKMFGNSTGSFKRSFEIANLSGIDANKEKSEYLYLYSPEFTKVYKHDNSNLFDSYIN
jgi:hypothetical protein